MYIDGHWRQRQKLKKLMYSTYEEQEQAEECSLHREPVKNFAIHMGWDDMTKVSLTLSHSYSVLENNFKTQWPVPTRTFMN